MMIQVPVQFTALYKSNIKGQALSVHILLPPTQNNIVWKDYICISLFLVPAAYHVAKAFMDSTV